MGVDGERKFVRCHDSINVTTHAKITGKAKVAAYLLDNPRTPAEIADHFRSYIRWLGLFNVTERLERADKRERLMSNAQETLDDLVARGWAVRQDELITGFSSGGRRLYRLGPALRSEGGHVKVGPSVVDLSLVQIEEQVMAYVQRYDRIQRGQVETLSGQSRDQAYRLLRRLVRQGKLEMVGRGRAAYYQPVASTPKGDA